MSRPPVGIDRLPARRLSNEPREAMNCKSCRKRKIKCNRVRPSCEACQVFQCPCIYDAIPKKRGPKTDVLEALLKRVNGLEKRLKTEDDAISPTAPPSRGPDGGDGSPNASDCNSSKEPLAAIEILPMTSNTNANITFTAAPMGASSALIPVFPPETLLDIYFERLHGKPLYILDEASTRARIRSNTFPSFIAYALYAFAARYATEYGCQGNAVCMSEKYACRARKELDPDEPSLEALQALLLLSQAALQAGKGKKAYMHLSMAINMAFALSLHRELPDALPISQAEREGRRRLFWSCYLLDRFAACGSKRPSLISDDAILLRMPGLEIQPGAEITEGEFFPGNTSLEYMAQPNNSPSRTTAMLIGISRILGTTNRYLAAGGAKGDSLFPWHSQSGLSKIRQELDLWASGMDDVFPPPQALLIHPECTVLLLGKLIYHVIHCLTYRPFLPLDLTELSGTSQHHSWQMEATNLCFIHANAIAELVQLSEGSSVGDWPSFVGYCITTAATVHVHGAHYGSSSGDLFSQSANYLHRAMQQLSRMRYIWTGIQHLQDSLRAVYSAHSLLVKSVKTSSKPFPSTMQMEDFFDRYPGKFFDAAYITLVDITEAVENESKQLYLHGNQHRAPSLPNIVDGTPQQYHPMCSMPPTHTAYSRKRRASDSLASFPEATRPYTSTEPSHTLPLPHSSGPMPVGQLYHTLSEFAFTPPVLDRPVSHGHGSNYGLPDATQSQQPVVSSYIPTTVEASSNPLVFANAEADGFKNTAIYSPMQIPPLYTLHLPPQHSQQGQCVAPEDNSPSTDSDCDPFRSLFEQLAENAQGRGGPIEMEYFLSG